MDRLDEELLAIKRITTRRAMLGHIYNGPQDWSENEKKYQKKKKNKTIKKYCLFSEIA